MSSIVACRCGKRFQAPAHLAGRQVPCPACGQTLSLPNSSAAAAAPAAGQAIIVTCGCGGRFQAPPSLQGKAAKCPKCQAVLQVPTTSGPAKVITAPAARPQPAPANDPFYDPLFAALPPAGKTLGPAQLAPASSFATPTAVAAHAPRGRYGTDYFPNRSTFELAILALFGLAALIIAPFILMQALGDSKLASASSKWPTTEATITSARIEERWARRGKRYTPHVDYVYTVEGRPYSGSTIAFGSPMRSAESTVEIYSQGSKHQVSYQPEDPSVCTLETGATASNFLFPIIAIAFGIAGLAGIFVNLSSIAYRIL